MLEEETKKIKLVCVGYENASEHIEKSLLSHLAITASKEEKNCLLSTAATKAASGKVKLKLLKRMRLSTPFLSMIINKILITILII